MGVLHEDGKEWDVDLVHRATKKPKAQPPCSDTHCFICSSLLLLISLIVDIKLQVYILQYF